MYYSDLVHHTESKILQRSSNSQPQQGEVPLHPPSETLPKHILRWLHSGIFLMDHPNPKQSSESPYYFHFKHCPFGQPRTLSYISGGSVFYLLTAVGVVVRVFCYLLFHFVSSCVLLWLPTSWPFFCVYLCFSYSLALVYFSLSLFLLLFVCFHPCVFSVFWLVLHGFYGLCFVFVALFIYLRYALLPFCWQLLVLTFWILDFGYQLIIKACFLLQSLFVCCLCVSCILAPFFFCKRHNSQCVSFNRAILAPR